MDRLLLALVAIAGVPAATAAYVVAVERLLAAVPERQRALRPWLWLGPAAILLLLLLAYPSLHTLYLSFLNADSSRPAGLENYAFIFSNPDMLTALRNNLLWIAFFTTTTVGLGLVAAALTDRVPYESIAKGVIFLPMAISFVAAGVIWRFMYDFRPLGSPQTGTVNALLLALVPGFEPQAWLVNAPWNNFALMIAAIWVWTGFCMVILSAAIKGIPMEVLDAARVDGAGEWTLFLRVVVPLIAPTITVVMTTMVIFALKSFDIVYVMTNGNYDTEVIASRMYKEMFSFRDFGRASAIAVLLLLATVPVLLLNLRRFRAQEEAR